MLRHIPSKVFEKSSKENIPEQVINRLCLRLRKAPGKLCYLLTVCPSSDEVKLWPSLNSVFISLKTALRNIRIGFHICFEYILTLRRMQVHVAIVTAAGYPGEANRFEERVSGLLAAFKREKLPKSVTDRSANTSLFLTLVHEGYPQANRSQNASSPCGWTFAYDGGHSC